MASNRFTSALGKAQSGLVLLYAVTLPVSLTASWIILCAGMAILATEAVVHAGSLSGRRIKIIKPPLLYPICVFALTVVLSSLAAGGLTEGWQALVSLRALLVYFWAFRVFQSDRALLWLAVQLLLLVGALAGVAGTVEQLFDIHPFGYRYLQGTGFLGNPMSYAGQMQMFCLLALGLLLTGDCRQFRWQLAKRPIFALVVAANLLGVVFAAERNAWFGALGAVLGLTALISWRTFLKCFLCLVVVSVVCWAAVPVVHNRIGQMQNWQQDVSVRVRLEIWRESLKVWQASPVFGCGIKRFPHFNIPEAVVPGHSKDLNHAHSNYLHILSTTGLLGLLGYLWLWFSVLFAAVKFYFQAKSGSQNESALGLGIFGSALALILSGVFEYNFGSSQIRLAQWFLLAMLPQYGKAESALPLSHGKRTDYGSTTPETLV